MAGHRLAARTIPDAFGLISTDGVAGVTVRVENRRIGETNGDGLLIAPLYGWLNNRISVDALDLPANLQIDTPHRQVVGRGQAGSLIRFGMRQTRSATISLVDEAGQPLPLGASVVRGGSGDGGAGADASDSDSAGAGAGAEPMVGYDGEVWLDELSVGDNRVEVELAPGQRCEAHFDLSGKSKRPSKIGPVTCKRGGSDR